MRPDPEHIEEPGRLLEEPQSPLTTALLQAGLWHDSSERRRLNVLAALGLGAGLATTSRVSLASVLTGSKKLLLGALAAGTGIGGAVVYTTASHQPAGPPAVVITATEPTAHTAYEAAAPPDQNKIVAETPARQDRRADSVSPTGETEARQVAAVRTLRGSAKPRPKKAIRREPAVASAPDLEESETLAHPVEADTLQQEVSLLDRARSAVQAGRASTALSYLSDHAKQFPAGKLKLEAEVLRIEALHGAGRTREARARARRILERDPNSVLASRLRRYVRN